MGKEYSPVGLNDLKKSVREFSETNRQRGESS